MDFRGKGPDEPWDFGWNVSLVSRSDPRERPGTEQARVPLDAVGFRNSGVLIDRCRASLFVVPSSVGRTWGLKPWRRRPGWACLGTLTGTWLRLFLRQWRIRSASIRRWSWWCKNSGMGYAPFASPFPGRGPLGAALRALSPPQDSPPSRDLLLAFKRYGTLACSSVTMAICAASKNQGGASSGQNKRRVGGMLGSGGVLGRRGAASACLAARDIQSKCIRRDRDADRC